MEAIIGQVDAENLYRTVYELEGVRNAISRPAGLADAARSIELRMAGAGLAVRRQPFRLDGWDEDFCNIEGSLGPVAQRPAAVLVAHYDTVEGSPGANDNAASVAVILEAGRLLASLPQPPPLYVVAVTLEESGGNPLIYGGERESALRHGVLTPAGQYSSWACAKLKPAIHRQAYRLYEAGMDQGEALRQALAERSAEVPPHLAAHIMEIIPLYQGITVRSAIGLRSRIGSHRWVQQALAEGRRIAFNITVDEVGIFRKEPFTQGLLAGRGFELFTQQHRTDPQNRSGDFVMLATIQGSTALGASYARNCEASQVDLPYGWVDLPLDFEGVAEHMAAGLGSDHAAFWQAGIPALFLFDTSTARDPWVHSAADSIDKIDFDRLAQVTQALIATLLDESLYPQ